MTKDKAYDILCSEYPAARNYEKFFRDTIDYFNGESNVVNEYCLDQIRRYLNSLT